ncbi:hypothetical protein PFLA_b1229 [Pseudoalteromonas flavipulchra NCIMB 2033 = ATCC BAA-314]|nr:hypothetical protein [Pseudoalteromonas flavipulchra NCIMB 2033 = ATCC BAA-314]
MLGMIIFPFYKRLTGGNKKVLIDAKRRVSRHIKYAVNYQ